MKKPKTGYIYFITEQGSETYIKIGFSTLNPKKRMKNLQTGNPRILELAAFFEVDDCHYYEKLIHKDFAFIRQSGEWFLRTKKVNIFLETAKERGFYQAIIYFVGGAEAILIAHKHGINLVSNTSFSPRLHNECLQGNEFSESDRYINKQFQLIQ